MSIPPPPPPPPPKSSIKSVIPSSNKQLLQSIERGIILKAVPETVKNDRSSALQATTCTVPATSAGRRVSAGPNFTQKPVFNNDSNDFQNQLMNRLSAMKLGGNDNFQEKRISVPNQQEYKAIPDLQSTINKAPVKNISTYNEPGKAPLYPYNPTSPMNNGATPPPAASNKPVLSKPFQSQFAPVIIPTPIASKPSMPTPNQSFNNSPSNPWTPAVNQNHFNSGRAPPPNQFQATNNRPPPPPPSKQKPVHRSSFNTDPVWPQSCTPPTTDLALRPRPLPPASSPPSTVTRTTANPPPPLPNFRLPSQRPQSASQSSFSSSSPAFNAPPVPSRVLSGQNSFSSSTISSKVLDRAPPPPPPASSSSSQQRLSCTTQFSSFDRKFKFPDECQFPELGRY